MLSFSRSTNYEPLSTAKLSKIGHVSVESEVGKGACFSIWLPTIKEKAGPELDLCMPVAGGSERILLVDDEKSLVDMG